MLEYVALVLEPFILTPDPLMRSIAIVVGSSSSTSINRRLATALEGLVGERFSFVDVRIDDLPMFNVDAAKEPPAEVLRMKKQILDAEGVIFVTPEHNRSIPAVLKNAIDWGSRPAGQSCWIGKPAAMLGASPGSNRNGGRAAASAQHSLAAAGDHDGAAGALSALEGRDARREWRQSRMRR